MGNRTIPTPCPHCGVKLGLGERHQKKKMRCPKCGTRFVAGTDQILSVGDMTEEASQSSKTKQEPKTETGPTPGGRKVKCVLCEFEIETHVPKGTTINCPLCNSVFSEDPSQVEEPEAETPSRPIASVSPPVDPPPPPKPELQTAPTQQAPRDTVTVEPLVRPTQRVRETMMMLNRPVELVISAAVSGLMALIGIVTWFLVFIDVDAPAKLFFGDVPQLMLILPVVTMACAAVTLGLWKREPWGWYLGLGLFTLGTVFFASRIMSGEIIITGAVGTVSLILLLFSRLSGRFQ